MISWQQPGRPVILASKSPRRRQILAQMGFTFETVEPSPIDESALINPGALESSLQELAKMKAMSVAERHHGALVFGADTVVVKGRDIMGKPASREEARSMLMKLAGARHTVMTGVALVCIERSFSAAATACTDVFFRPVSVDEIEAYLTLDEYRDKAGAYAIQERAMIFIEKIHGCYYNVVGLPVSETVRMFESFVRTGSCR